MKKFLILLLVLSCSAPDASSPDDARILEGLHDEPMRMGTKKVQKEGVITTEVWTYSEEHGSPDSTVETLMYKNGKLVSHALSDSASKHSFSRQYKDGKLIEATETQGEKSTSWFFDADEKLKGRVSSDGKTARCFLYTNGKNPRSEKLESCEREFNTAP